ncbi:cyclin-D-binding Myb-like transcription factor 1 [Porites lutea]|uniref:cyclin-D-binding Myb-like transcription factor 1 n=1 Tax=Porites lutea TaxID=51062 RepID=UPI003CC6C066
MKDDEDKKWTKENELQLITRLYNSGIIQECDVDWMEVKSDLKSICPPQWLRKKWSQVKRKAPNYHLLEFEDILDYLYHVYSKNLRAQLESDATTSSNDTIKNPVQHEAHGGQGGWA